MKLKNKKLQNRFTTGKKIEIETKANNLIIYNNKPYYYPNQQTRDHDFQTIRKHLNQLKSVMFS